MQKKAICAPKGERHKEMTPVIYAGLTPHHQVLVREGRTDRDVDSIINKVSTSLGVSIEALKSTSRKREHVEARTICVGLILQVNEITLHNLGKLFNRDHSTIIYQRDLFNDLMQSHNKNFTKKVELVLKEV